MELGIEIYREKYRENIQSFYELGHSTTDHHQVVLKPKRTCCPFALQEMHSYFRAHDNSDKKQ